MPIYEYRCSDCSQVSERLVGIGRNSDALVCGSCGGSRLERIMSASAFSINSRGPATPNHSTCCGGNPSTEGCIPGSCCGSA